MASGDLTTWDGVRLHYERLGKGGSPIIVGARSFLIHDWAPLIRTGRDWVMYDQRNRGASEAIEHPYRVSFMHEVQDIDAVRSFFGFEKITLIGWSYMGAVAAHYAARYRRYVEKLVMIGAVAIARLPFYANGIPNQDKAQARVDPDGVKYVESLRAQGLHESDPLRFCRENARVYRPRQMGKPETVASMKSDPCQYPNEHPDRVAAYFKRLWNFEEWDWRVMTQAIQAPTLVIHGDEDLIPMESAREWAALIPKARLEVMRGVGHFPWLESPDEFFSVMDEFIGG